MLEQTAAKTAPVAVVQAPLFPTYAEIGHAIRGLDGEPVKRIAEPGLAWLKGFADVAHLESAARPSPKRTTVAEAARAHNEEQFVAFRERLMALDPVQFEHFVKELLDAMDYEDVRVTKVSNDKGVDVIARAQFGITEITEVVQVKRTESTITLSNNSGLRDNHTRGSVADFLKAKIKSESQLSVVSAYFTIYAYDALKNYLDRIAHLDFLFRRTLVRQSPRPEQDGKENVYHRLKRVTALE